MTHKKFALVAFLALVVCATGVAVCWTPATVPAVLRVDNSMLNHESGLRIGLKTDHAANLIGYATVETAKGVPAQIASATLIVDGVSYPAVQQPDGSWEAFGPPARRVTDVRIEAVEVGKPLRYYELLGIK